MRRNKTSFKQRAMFFVVAAIILLIAVLSVFGFKYDDFQIKSVKNIRFGIDINGGVSATFVPSDGTVPSEEQLESARIIIETRLDNKKILDRNVTVVPESGQILVEFPWSENEKEFDPAKAIEELGATAELSFWPVEVNEETGEETKVGEAPLLTGANVKKATAASVEQNNYVVDLEFDDTGAKLFADATKTYLNKYIGIYMDDELISAPVVKSEITDGKAQISSDGGFTMDEVIDLASKINAGALPFSLKATNYNSISATLGEGALNTMLNAGIIAFILVSLFMLIYYRLPGFVACINLILQVSGQLLIFSGLGLTLTLPGIAGIILAIGMSVDSNIIISENIKDEINNNKTVKGAVASGFSRAFSAVLDCNVTTAIIALLLLKFGTGAMLSFGYTLLIGNIMNFCFGIIASKLMMTSLVTYKPLCKPWLCGAKRQKGAQQ